MIRKLVFLGAAAMIASPAAAQTSNTGASEARNMQSRATAQIPVCSRRLGTIAIVEPDNQWWREYNLGSPEAILKVFVQQSGCFSIVNRGRSMQSRAMERALAEQGELQQGSNVGGGQVKTADYFLEPNIVTANNNSGGGWWGGFAAAGGHGYQNTEIGQVIVLAYLDAYTRLVTQLGGLPQNASAAAPQAQ